MTVDDHMHVVAKRNCHLSEAEFRRYLAKCGWVDKEISAMWQIAQKHREKKGE